MVKELQTEIADLKGDMCVSCLLRHDRQFLYEMYGTSSDSEESESESLEDSDTTGESTSNLGTSSDSEEPTTSDEEFINDSSETKYVLSVTFENEKQKETIKITVDAEEYDDFDEDDIEGMSDWIENNCYASATLDWSSEDIDMDWKIVG